MSNRALIWFVLALQVIALIGIGRLLFEPKVIRFTYSDAAPETVIERGKLIDLCFWPNQDEGPCAVKLREIR